MDIEEIKKVTSEFEAQLKGLGSASKPAPEPVPELIPEPVAEPTLEPVGACLTKTFKSVVDALSPSFIGTGDVPDLVKEFLDTGFVECEV